MEKRALFVVAIVVSVITIGGLSFYMSDIGRVEAQSEINADVSSKGKHCSYTVGCDCSGFSPKTKGKEWEKSYCRRCGHHKKYHR